MPNATLNAVTFTGNVFSDPATVRRAPKTITPKPRKVGTLLEADSGTRNWMHRTTKVDQLLEWENVAELTRAAVYAVFSLTTTFSGTTPSGTATYQCEETDYDEKEAFTMPDGTKFYNVTLLIRQP